MSQTEQYGADNIMHYTPQVKATQTSFICPVPTVNIRPSCMPSGTSSDSDSDNSSSKMHSQFRYPHPHTSGTSTPISTTSSTSYVSNASSLSSTVTRPRRSSLKSSLRPSRSVGENLNKSSPPIVRFADPEPVPKVHPWPATRQHIRQQTEPLINRIPDPHIKSRHHYNPTFSLSTTDLTKYPRRPLVNAPRPVPRVSPQTQQPGSRNTMKTSVSIGGSAPILAPAPLFIQEPKWPGSLLPAHLPPPVFSAESRKPSHQSSDSNASVQSAPPVLTTLPNPDLPPAQYNPLQNYVPCLYPTCYSHYTPVHENPTHYMEPDPYNLVRHHGYCARHAKRELREATAICKKELERLRQNAGRKTLGLIAVEFEIYLEHFRTTRRDVDAQLQQQQKIRVLGSSSTQPTTLQNGKVTEQEQDSPSTAWDWRYTPRLCTRSDCHSLPYSPYANHLYAYYTTRRNSSFVPLQTLCPPCAKAEVELFEAHIREIRASRPVWNKEEWNAWFVDAARDRDMELEFWSRVQERGVRGRGPAVSDVNGEGKGESGNVNAEGKGKKARKSLLNFWKIFGGKTAT